MLWYLLLFNPSNVWYVKQESYVFLKNSDPLNKLNPDSFMKRSSWSLPCSIGMLCASLMLFQTVGVGIAVADDESWWPLQVKSYYGTYDPSLKQPGHAAPGLDRPKLEEWVPPRGTGSSYRLGVSFPHLKDPYWVAVNYGIIMEAKHLGLGITLLEAGGYGKLQAQVDQIRTLANAKVDGIIVGAISYTGNDVVIAEMAQLGIPVVEVINDVHAPAVAAKALVSFQEMGYIAGEYLAEHAEKAGLANVHIAFFPGPQKSGWAPETLDGFKAAMEFFPGEVDIVDVRWGDTGFAEQRELLRDCLKKCKSVDYVVGNAVAAQAATDLLQEMGLADQVKVVSTYIIPSLYDRIRKGQIIAAPSDLTVFQGRMAVDMMVRTLEGQKPGRDFPFRSGPFIPIITPDNVESYPYEGLFGPRDYVPVFNLEPRQ